MRRRLLGCGDIEINDKGVKGDRFFVEEVESLAGGTSSGQVIDEEVMTDLSTTRKRCFVLVK